MSPYYAKYTDKDCRKTCESCSIYKSCFNPNGKCEKGKNDNDTCDKWEDKQEEDE